MNWKIILYGMATLTLIVISIATEMWIPVVIALALDVAVTGTMLELKQEKLI